MTHEAEQLLAEAKRRVKLDESFCPVEIGARIDLPQAKAEAAARALSNAGILVLGFDSAAEFTADYRKACAKANAAAAPKGRRKKISSPIGAGSGRTAGRQVAYLPR